MPCVNPEPIASTSQFRIPTSASRDEPFLRPRPRGDSFPHAHVSPTPFLRPEYQKYMVRHPVEVAPGVLDDCRITARHPLVALLLANIPAVSPAEGRKPPVEEWIKRGMKEKTVNDILDIDRRLSEYQSECIFVLAALSVLRRPKHPKHFSFWGRDPAPKTAERVNKVLEAKPCPVEPPASWVGIPEELWFLASLQGNLYPTKKEGKKVDNGMLLRKRRAHAASAAHSGPLSAEAAEPPRKRVRTSRAVRKEPIEADATSTELSALPLPQLEAIQPAEAEAAAEKPMNKAMKLELIGIESPFANTLEIASNLARPSTRDSVAPPEPTRRSARQAKKKPTPGSASATATPMTEAHSLPETLTPLSVPSEVEEPQRPPMTRARSSSSASGSSTAVSETGSAGDTAVEPDAVDPVGSGKAKAAGKRKRVQEVEPDVEGEKAPVRSSGRVRKPAKKALHVDEDATVPTQKNAATPVAESRRTRTRRS